MTAAKKATKAATSTRTQADTFSDDERGAMKERAKELRTNSRSRARAAEPDGEAEVFAKLAEMPESDRVIGERLHAVIKASAPTLTPKLWYGMPAYARDGKIICFFQSSQKFKTRYATLGFSDEANLDDGAVFPVTFAVTELTAAAEAKISALLKQAVS